jgi:group I intron endonuclease
MESSSAKKRIDYTKTVIYKIVCKDKSIVDIYVGSTVDFKNRRDVHKNDSKKKLHLPLYATINSNGGWDNWEMVLIESYPCNTIQEARLRENYWILELKPTLNKNTPLITTLTGETSGADNSMSSNERNKINSAFRSKTIYTEWVYLKKQKTQFEQYEKEKQELQSQIDDLLKQLTILKTTEDNSLAFYKEENRLLRELFKNTLNNT